jgi:hypothetical protein
MPRSIVVVRCPLCGSTRAGEVNGAYELGLMRCEACGHEKWCDNYEVKFEWNTTIFLPDDATELPEFVAPLDDKPD